MASQRLGAAFIHLHAGCRQKPRLAATRFGVEPRYRVLTPFMLKVAGVFNSDVRELGEMLYQYDSPYVFDSSKFTKALRFEPTDYATGIEQTRSTYQAQQ